MFHSTQKNAVWPRIHSVLWNPVLRRETLTGLRSSKLRWIIFVYLTLPFAVLMADWPTGEVFYGGSSLAVNLWNTFLVTQLLQMVLLIPVFAAYSVSSEFDRSTADLLWTSSIRPWLIIFSKIAAVFSISGVLLISSLAALSTLFYLGGVGISELLAGYVLIAVTALYAATAAVCYSALTRKGHLSLFLSYTTSLVFLAVGAGSEIILESDIWLLVTMLFTMSLVFAFFACKAGRRLVGERNTKPVKLLDDPNLLKRRLRSWPYYLIDPRKRLMPISDTEQVVVAQELRLHPLHRSAWRYRCAYLMAIVSVLFVLLRFFEPSEREFLDMLMLAVPCVWIVLLHAISMSMDQEMGTLDCVRLTPIGPVKYLEGKWVASLKNRSLLIAIGVIAIGCHAWQEEGHVGTVIVSIGFWILIVETVGLMALAISSFCSRTMMAISLSLAAASGVILFHTWLVSEAGPFVWDVKLTIFYLLLWLDFGLACWAVARIGIGLKWKLER